MSSDFGASGQAIWDAYGAGGLSAGAQALVRELARSADMCDRIDGLASGRKETWAFLTFDDMGEIHLNIDKLLDQQIKAQGMLKQLHAEVRQAGLKTKLTGDAIGGTNKDEGPKDMLAELRRQKERRESQPG